MTYWSLLSISAPVLAVMAAGGGVRRAGWLSQEADASLLRLVFNLLYPCLVFDSVLGNAAARSPGNLATAPAAGASSLLLGFGLAFAMSRLVNVGAGPTRRAFRFAAGVHNYGYVAIPVVQQLYPRAIGVLFVYTLGVELTLWTVGIAVLSGPGERALWRRLANPTVGAILLGLALDVAGLDAHVPAAVRRGVHLLGACAVPLGLLLIGATIADELGRRASPGRPAEAPGRPWRAVLLAHALRLGVLPLLVLTAARWLPLSVELKQVLVVQAAMPAAVLPVVLTKHYRGDTRTALWISIGTNALGVLSIPSWLRLGMALVGV
jgi:predicted permease